MAATMLNTTEVAEALETTPRELRKFLRSITEKENQPGKGSRWQLEKGKLRSLRSQFNKWTAENEARKAAAEESTPEVDENESETDESTD